MLATVHIGRWRVATSSHQKIWDSTRRPPGRRLADEGVKYDRGACDEKRSLGERDVRRRGQFGHGPAATYRYDAAVNTASPARAAPAPEPIRRARDAVATEETKEAVKARAGARKAAETRCPPVPGERGGGDTPAYKPPHSPPANPRGSGPAIEEQFPAQAAQTWLVIDVIPGRKKLDGQAEVPGRVRDRLHENTVRTPRNAGKQVRMARGHA